MGTTLGNLHLYTHDRQLAEEVQRMGHTALCLSDGWISILDRSFQAGVLNKEAKRLSKAINAPLLSFFLFDDDWITLGLWKDGKCIAEYTDYPRPALKGCKAFAQHLEWNEADEARFRQILRCEHAQYKSELLEELFGVALLIDTDFLNEDSKAFMRRKSCSLFHAYREEQARTSGSGRRIKAVLTQRIAARLSIVWDQLLVTYPDKNGVHSPWRTQPCVLKEGILQLLLGEGIYAPIPSFVLRTDGIVTVLEPSHPPQGGKTTYPKAVQYDLNGQKIREFSIPDGVPRFPCALPDGSLIGQLEVPGETGSQGRPSLVCIGTSGRAAWRVNLGPGSFHGNAFVYQQALYVLTHAFPDGTTIHRLDFQGNVLNAANFKDFLGMDCLCSAMGSLFFASQRAGGKEGDARSIIVLDDTLSIRASLALPQGVVPVIPEHLHGALIDEKEKKLYFHALYDKFICADFSSMQCLVEKSPRQCFLRCRDSNGLIYAVEGSSTVCVLDEKLRPVARHRLKGNIQHMEYSGESIYAVVSTGEHEGWGEPENCHVCVYRLHVEDSQ